MEDTSLMESGLLTLDGVQVTPFEFKGMTLK